MNKFEHMCACLVARQGWNAGQTVEEIAKLAKRSPSTISKWIKTTGVHNLKRG